MSYMVMSFEWWVMRYQLLTTQTLPKYFVIIANLCHTKMHILGRTRMKRYSKRLHVNALYFIELCLSDDERRGVRFLFWRRWVEEIWDTLSVCIIVSWCQTWIGISWASNIGFKMYIFWDFSLKNTRPLI